MNKFKLDYFEKHSNIFTITTEKKNLCETWPLLNIPDDGKNNKILPNVLNDFKKIIRNNFELNKEVFYSKIPINWQLSPKKYDFYDVKINKQKYYIDKYYCTYVTLPEQPVFCFYQFYLNVNGVIGVAPKYLIYQNCRTPISICTDHNKLIEPITWTSLKLKEGLKRFPYPTKKYLCKYNTIPIKGCWSYESTVNEYKKLLEDYIKEI